LRTGSRRTMMRSGRNRGGGGSEDRRCVDNELSGAIIAQTGCMWGRWGFRDSVDNCNRRKKIFDLQRTSNFLATGYKDVPLAYHDCRLPRADDGIRLALWHFATRTGLSDQSGPCEDYQILIRPASKYTLSCHLYDLCMPECHRGDARICHDERVRK